VRNPLWRKGGTVFGPQPRSYEYALPRKVERGALRATIAQKLSEGVLTVVDALAASEVKTRAAAEMLKGLGAASKALLVDESLDEKLALSVRNLESVRFVLSNRVTARDIMHATRVIATRAAVERLQEVLA
jgi:large subunit ribosomal protein L4